MPRDTGLPPGTLTMLVLRVLKTQPLHGYAIAQRIHLLSAEELRVEEGSLYPAAPEAAGQRLGTSRVARIGVRAAGARIPHHVPADGGSSTPRWQSDRRMATRDRVVARRGVRSCTMAIIGEWIRRVGYLLRRRARRTNCAVEMEAHRAQMGAPPAFGNTLRLRGGGAGCLGMAVARRPGA